MSVLAFALLFLGSTAGESSRVRRGSYSLPDGSEFIVGLLKTSFRCRANGYFADVDNHCQVFHVCHEQPNFMGPSRFQLFSFVCGNTTMFDQLTLTCMYPEDAIPCGTAPLFYDVNSNVGDDSAYFLTDDDVERGAQHHTQESHGGFQPPPPQPHPPLPPLPPAPPPLPVPPQYHAPEPYFTGYRELGFYEDFDDSPPFLTTTSTTTTTTSTTTTTPRPSTTRHTTRTTRRGKYFGLRPKQRLTPSPPRSGSLALGGPTRHREHHEGSRRKLAPLGGVQTARPAKPIPAKPERPRRTKIIVTDLRGRTTRHPALLTLPPRRNESVPLAEKLVPPFSQAVRTTARPPGPRLGAFEDETHDSLLKQLEDAFARDYPNIHPRDQHIVFPGVGKLEAGVGGAKKSEPLVFLTDDLVAGVNRTTAKQAKGGQYKGKALLNKAFIQVAPQDEGSVPVVPAPSTETAPPITRNAASDGQVQAPETLGLELEKPVSKQHDGTSWKDESNDNSTRSYLEEAEDPLNSKPVTSTFTSPSEHNGSPTETPTAQIEREDSVHSTEKTSKVEP